jgi:NADH:ubiquinone oxidoreductase subunit K
MIRRNLVLNGIGIFLIVLAVIFSFVPYNPGKYATVHQYAYGCLSNMSDFKQTYSYVDSENERYHCHHNASLSSIIFGIGIVGFILLIKSKIKKTNKN